MAAPKPEENSKPDSSQAPTKDPLLSGTLGHQIEEAKQNPAIVMPEERPRKMPE